MSDKVVFYTPDNDTKIAGLYDLEHTIGRGHYAVVKLARHVFTGEKVAVKVIDKTKLDNMAQDHLFQEVVCMKLVQHPNVVRLYEVIDTPAKLYLILELGDGGDLYDYIMRHGCGLHEEIAKRYFRQIVTAIAYCHKLHVVHRDLKPENVVFFEKLGLVKLTDFGFSNRFTPGRNLDTSCGSLAYSAPEILLGDPYDAPKVDIWSLGVILYMLVCGHLPFHEATDSETLTKIMDCKYVIPDYLSAECSQLIARLLVRDPERRAHLDDILQAEWLRQDAEQELPIELFSIPLVSKECLSFEEHMEILSKMSEGQLATVEEIQSTLDRNEYNHIAATYFLLAERKLKRRYIEQYNLLTQQAQLTERMRQQQLQQLQANVPGSVEQGQPVQYNESSGKAVSVAPRLIGTVPMSSQSSEERVRRFSMILEDEEEEEEERTPFVFPKLDQFMPGGDMFVLPERGTAQPDLEDAVQEALLEEEEEMLTVANLASVRSDLAEHPSFPAMHDGREGALNFARPCSGASVSLVEVSDETESDASLSNWSTTGNGLVSTLPQASLARSLPSAEIRKKSYRRVLVPHRPLISVRSSPQLLKHIAEEEWNSAPTGSTNIRGSNPRERLERLFKHPGSPRRSTDDVGDTHSLRVSFYALPKFTSLDDQSVEMRSRPSWAGQRALSTTHSPTRAKRLFTSNTTRSRPTSIGSWSAAFNLSLLNDLRRRSLCSSPAETFNIGVPIKRKALPFGYPSQLTMSSFRGHVADRRCSGPPNFSESSFSYPIPVVPIASPSRSESEASFARRLNVQLRSQNQSEREQLDSDLVKPSSSTRNFTSTPYLTDVGASGKDPQSGDGSPIAKRHSLATDTRSPNRALTSLPRRPPTRSPNRSFTSAPHSITWSNSTPMLFNYPEQLPNGADNVGTGFSVPHSITTANAPSIVNPCTATLREYCAPIREEEDEFARTADGVWKASGDSDQRVRRSSESSVFRSSTYRSGTSGLTGDSTRNVVVPLVPTVADRSRPATRLTDSNFSLSSLASGLRDSRYMLDIIRGTFELQCHYNRQTVSSFAGGSCSGLHSGRASTSVSVRSLTGLSEGQSVSVDHQSEFRDDLRRPVTTYAFPALTSKGLSPGHPEVQTRLNGLTQSDKDRVQGESFCNDSGVPDSNSIHANAVSPHPKPRRTNSSFTRSRNRPPRHSPLNYDRKIPSSVGMVKFDKHGDLRLVDSHSSDLSANNHSVSSNHNPVLDTNNSNSASNVTQSDRANHLDNISSPKRSHRSLVNTRFRRKHTCCAIS